MLPETLPEKDHYGNYYLGLDHFDCAAIFAVKPQGSREACAWIASQGGELGFLFHGREFLYFNSPEEALLALRNDSRLPKVQAPPPRHPRRPR